MVRGGPAFDSGNPTGVIIPTVLQMASYTLGYWTSMTCYNMEIIVPFQTIGRYLTEGVKFATDLIGNMFNLFGVKKNVMSKIFSSAMSNTL